MGFGNEKTGRRMKEEDKIGRVSRRNSHLIQKNCSISVLKWILWIFPIFSLNF